MIYKGDERFYAKFFIIPVTRLNKFSYNNDILLISLKIFYYFNYTVHDFLLNVNTFTSMFFDIMDKLSTQQQVLVAMTLWSLWKSRNTKLWEALDTSPSSIAAQAKDTLNE